MSECDCAVGELVGRTTRSEIVDKIISEADGWTRHSETIASLKGVPQEAKTYTPAMFLDRRRGFINFYNYCPHCGSEIAWKAIKREVVATGESGE